MFSKMYNWFKSLGKERGLPTSQKEDEEKEYVFLTSEAHCIGDWYKYTVKAKSKEEALKKLVVYFHGSEVYFEDITSKSGNISYPNLSRVRNGGLPRWFYNTISGSSSKEDRKKLVNYANKNNIKLKEKWL